MTEARTYTIDIIAGDGIGPEVIPAATRCVDALGDLFGFRVLLRSSTHDASRRHRADV